LAFTQVVSSRPGRSAVIAVRTEQSPNLGYKLMLRPSEASSMRMEPLSLIMT